MAEFELDYSLTQDDWQKYRQSYVRRFQAEQKSLFGSSSAMFGAMLIVGLLLALAFGFMQKIGLMSAASPLGLLMGFGAGVVAVMIWASSWSHRIERWGHDSGGYILGPRRLKVNDEGVMLAGANYESHFGWGAFREFTENRGVALLWLDRGSALVVPERAFGDALVKRAFIELVRRNIGAKDVKSPQHAFA